MLSAFIKILLVLAVAYGLLVLFVYLMQGRMLYLADLPGRALEATLGLGRRTGAAGCEERSMETGRSLA